MSRALCGMLLVLLRATTAFTAKAHPFWNQAPRAGAAVRSSVEPGPTLPVPPSEPRDIHAVETFLNGVRDHGWVSREGSYVLPRSDQPEDSPHGLTFGLTYGEVSFSECLPNHEAIR